MCIGMEKNLRVASNNLLLAFLAENPHLEHALEAVRLCAKEVFVASGMTRSNA